MGLLRLGAKWKSERGFILLLGIFSIESYIMGSLFGSVTDSMNKITMAWRWCKHKEAILSRILFSCNRKAYRCNSLAFF
jgi:hypothetical protein